MLVQIIFYRISFFRSFVRSFVLLFFCVVTFFIQFFIFHSFSSSFFFHLISFLCLSFLSFFFFFYYSFFLFWLSDMCTHVTTIMAHPRTSEFISPERTLKCLLLITVHRTLVSWDEVPYSTQSIRYLHSCKQVAMAIAICGGNSWHKYTNESMHW